MQIASAICFNCRCIVCRNSCICEISRSVIAVLEIIGLMYADGGYDDEERAFVDSFAKGIGVLQESVKKCEDTLVKYVDMTRELLGCIK